MKNKTKKILAIAGLGLVGASCLTGCGLSEEQQSALDKLVGSADKLIELTEDNMAKQNAKLSKEEVVEKIIIARNFWLSPEYNCLWSFNAFA